MINKTHTREFGGRYASARPDLISVQIHTDWSECPRDKRDVSTGQMGDFYGTNGIQIWRCPAKFLNVYWV